MSAADQTGADPAAGRGGPAGCIPDIAPEKAPEKAPVRPLRVVYMATVATKEIVAEIGGKFQVYSAARKVTTVLSAVSRLGHESILVASPLPLHTNTRRWFRGGSINGAKYTTHFGRSTTFKILNRLVFAPCFYLSFVVKNRRCTYIFYNYYPEYVLAAAYLFLIGNRGYLDIEDHPVRNWVLREIVARWSYPVMLFLCRPRVICASTGIGELSRAPAYHVIHGIADPASNTARRDFANPTLSVLFGGTLVPDLGTELLADCVDLMQNSGRFVANPIAFHVTGFGDPQRLRALAQAGTVNGVTVFFHGEVNHDQYLEVSTTCTVGLSLRIPESDTGVTTFPSKVAEIAALGMGLVTTDISDVKRLFGDTAIYLDPPTADNLMRVLFDLTQDKTALQRLAQVCHQRGIEVFSPGSVGASLVAFLRDDGGAP